MELTSNYNKFAVYKVNMQKSIAFLYSNSEQVGFEIKTSSPQFCCESKTALKKYFKNIY